MAMASSIEPARSTARPRVVIPQSRISSSLCEAPRLCRLSSVSVPASRVVFFRRVRSSGRHYPVAGRGGCHQVATPRRPRSRQEPPMPRRIYPIALLTMLLAAPAVSPAATCDGEAWVESTLYMGRGLADGGMAADSEIDAFVADTIVDRKSTRLNSSH